MFFSIIIPVYNIEYYVRRCVNSVLAQDFRDYELILVDDGSTDGSAEACDGYAAGDSRVIVLRKENGGLSSARNDGLDAASGRYILFIDGDDFIEAGSLARIANALLADNFPDVMFLSAVMYYNDGRTEPYGHSFSREDFYGKPGAGAALYLSSTAQFHVSACVKAVRRDFLEAHKIRFTEGIVGEDVDYSINVYLNAGAYSALDSPYYCYRQNREGSIMSPEFADKRRADLIQIVEVWKSRAKYDIKNRKLILRFLYHQYYILADKPKAAVMRIVRRMFGIGIASKLINL